MTEKEESFFSKNKNLLMTSATLSGLGLLWVLYNRKFKKVKEQYGLEGCSAALREFNKEFYPVYCMIAGDIKRMHQNVAQQTGMYQLTPEIKAEVKQVFLSQSTWITTDVQNIEQKILTSHKFNKYSYQNMIEHKYAENREIVNLRKQIDDAFDKAFDGILPAMDPTIIPDTFTIEDVLGIYRDTITWQLNYITNEAIKIKEAGIFV